MCVLCKGMTNACGVRISFGVHVLHASYCVEDQLDY